MKLKTATYGLYRLLILAGVVTLGACAEHTREYSEDLQHFDPQVRMTADLDMYESPSLETYQETDLFDNGLTSQHPVAGTIARGFMPYPYPDDTSGYRKAGIEWTNPVVKTLETLEKGKDLYTKFCGHCHGESGNGDGSVIQNSKFPPPPSYLTGNSSGGGTMMELSEGKMFHTITYGRNMMGSHASQLNHGERWMIIHYIKSLQAAVMPADDTGDAVIESKDKEVQASVTIEVEEVTESTGEGTE
ncbi:MAG: cytochrome c [Flavobacteriales bacterium]|nr:cytochrome c [Flavobacteriales bacterium]